MTLVYSFLIIVVHNVKSVLFCVWLVAVVFFFFASKLYQFAFFNIYIFYLTPCHNELYKKDKDWICK
jgi:hypothetical protein